MSRRYPRIRRVLHESPWAILPSKLAEITEFIELKADGVEFSAEEIEARIGGRRQSNVQVTGGVAVLPLFGTIMPRSGIMTEYSGGTSIASFREDFREALNDESVGTILLEIDSPGGLVDGVPELAEEIRAARGSKRIVTSANYLAASAAYWIGTQADEFVITPSGLVGSVGVLMTHVNEGRRMDAEGYDITYISAGRYKTEGNPYEPLNDEARDHYQEIVDDLYGQFVTAVAKGRGVSVGEVRSGFGEGRVVTARQAVREGMADRVEAMPQTVARLARGRGGSSRRRADVGDGGDTGPISVDRLRRERKLASLRGR